MKMIIMSIIAIVGIVYTSYKLSDKHEITDREYYELSAIVETIQVPHTEHDLILWNLISRAFSDNRVTQEEMTAIKNHANK